VFPLVALLAWPVARGLAGPAPVDISCRVSVGTLNGEAEEIVYVPYDFAGERTAVSELTWDLSGLVMAGATVSADFRDQLLLNVSLWTALNEGDGEMHNFDWLVPGDDWTDWSRSEVDVTQAIVFDINGSAEFFHWRKIAFRAIAGYKHGAWKWTDRGQEFVYSVDGFRDTRGSFEGTPTVDYEQVFLIPYSGFGAGGLLGPMEARASFTFSNLVAARDRDHHKLRTDFGPGGLHFEEIFFFGTYVGLDASVEYSFTGSMTAGVSADLAVIPETVGEMRIIETGDVLPRAAGISHRSLLATAWLGWRF